MRTPTLAVLFAVSLGAQDASQLQDATFPPFANGDGRQKLSEFAGQPVLVVTFHEGWGGTSAALVALDLHQKHAQDGLVVVLSHNAPLRQDGTEMDAGAWGMRRHPDADVRWCGSIARTPWDWDGLLPPCYAVVGADGRLVRAGNVERSTKEMVEAVHAAVRQAAKGWGDAAEAAVRAHCVRGELAKARAKADDCGLGDEVDALFERRCGTVRWLQTDGQWLRAKKEAERLAAAAKGVAEWDAAVASLLASFADEPAKRELALDARLARVLTGVARSGPTADTVRRLRELAAKDAGSSVAARAQRLAARAEQAVAIR